jgi:hypothetical protein
MVPIGTIIQPVDGWLRLPHQMYSSTELKSTELKSTELKKNMMMERFIHLAYQGQD